MEESVFTKDLPPLRRKPVNELFGQESPPRAAPDESAAAVEVSASASQGRSKRQMWRAAVRGGDSSPPSSVTTPVPSVAPIENVPRPSRRPEIEISLDRPARIPDFSPKMDSFSAGCREQLIPSSVPDVQPGGESAPPTPAEAPEAPPQQEDESIQHLVLIVHGINSSEEYLYKNLAKARESFEQVRFLWFQNRTTPNVCHIELINWKAAVIGLQSSLFDKITPRGSLPVESRMFINYAISDVAFYLTPKHSEMMKQVVLDMLNQRVKDLKARYPSKFRNTKISIVGYSLGSVILHDILSEDKSRLDFDIWKLFFWGSPLSAYLSVKDNAYQTGKFVLPNHHDVFNIYHPHDPVAFRIEPLFYHLDSEIADPELVPDYENDGEKSKQKLKNGWFSLSSASESLSNGNMPLVPKRRLDFVLQESLAESLSHHYSMLTAHHSYWGSRDVALFMLRRLTGLEPEHAE